eukprot:SAG22_NODE_1796_length_3550_cov_3.789047_4_plen_456_part_00
MRTLSRVSNLSSALQPYASSTDMYSIGPYTWVQVLRPRPTTWPRSLRSRQSPVWPGAGWWPAAWLPPTSSPGSPGRRGRNWVDSRIFLLLLARAALAMSEEMELELPFQLISEDETGVVKIPCSHGGKNFLKKQKSGNVYVTTLRLVFVPDKGTRVARGSEQSTLVKKEVRIMPSRVKDYALAHVAHPNEWFLVRIVTIDPKEHRFGFKDAEAREKLKKELDTFHQAGKFPEAQKAKRSAAEARLPSPAHKRPAVDGPAAAGGGGGGGSGAGGGDPRRQYLDSEHENQYKSLVEGGLISAEDFWNDRSIADELELRQREQRQITEQTATVGDGELKLRPQFDKQIFVRHGLLSACTCFRYSRPPFYETDKPCCHHSGRPILTQDFVLKTEPEVKRAYQALVSCRHQVTRTEVTNAYRNHLGATEEEVEAAVAELMAEEVEGGAWSEISDLGRPDL